MCIVFVLYVYFKCIECAMCTYLDVSSFHRTISIALHPKVFNNYNEPQNTSWNIFYHEGRVRDTNQKSKLSQLFPQPYLPEKHIDGSAISL